MADNTNTAGLGVTSIRIGQSLLYFYPNAIGNVAPYPSYVTGTTKIDPIYIESAARAGMFFGDVRGAGPLLQPGEFGYSPNLTHLFGNSAAIAEGNTLKASYGDNISPIKYDLQGKFQQSKYVFEDGSSFRPDLQYGTYSEEFGRAIHFDEIKAVANLTDARYGGQLFDYGRALNEINSQSAFYRSAAGNLNTVGKGFIALDAGFTGVEAVNQLYHEDYSGAFVSVARFGGRYEGAVYGSAVGGGLAGALLGAEILGSAGGAGGTIIAPGPGTIALGLGGMIVGGIGGAFLGDYAVQEAARYLGLLSDDDTFSQPLGPIDFGSPSGVPGISFTSAGAYFGSFAPGYSSLNDSPFGSASSLSASQIAGHGWSLTSDIGSGGMTSAASYVFTPGQTTNSLYSGALLTGYSPTYDYSGNGYSDYGSSGYYGDYSYDSSSYWDSVDYGSIEFDSYGLPVVLDLDGNGLNITPETSSNFFYDLAGDGYEHRTAWAGAGNGVLVLDVAGTGQITERDQVIFTDWDPTATSDMQALANVFDTNHNGKLDAGDAQFASFKIMVTNSDGTTTLTSLADAGVQSINLAENAVSTILPDGSVIQGRATFTHTDNSTGTAATVAFRFDDMGYAVTQTVTSNPDGSTTINNKALNADGSLANETTTVTSADGSCLAVLHLRAANENYSMPKCVAA